MIPNNFKRHDDDNATDLELSSTSSPSKADSCKHGADSLSCLSRGYHADGVAAKWRNYPLALEAVLSKADSCR